MLSPETLLGSWMLEHVSEMDGERIANPAPFAARTFIAYAGSFESAGDRVIHHLETNSFPNDVGVDYIRLATLDGGSLQLATPPDLPPGQKPMRLFWRRYETPAICPQSDWAEIRETFS